MQSFDVIVLGGGAAGLMCAQVAGRRGRRVLLLERANRTGKKILMSGGGRCNFTNLYCEPSRFLSANPAFCVSALSRYTPADFIALVEKHAVPFHEKTAGQLFCDRSSKDIVNLLHRECAEAGVEIRTQCETRQVECRDRYELTSNLGRFAAEALVIATGGLSIPKMGGSDFGYRLARQFGMRVLDTRAGLVPFTFTGDMHAMTGRLSGISLEATLTTGNASFRDSLLFTHRGLSGPAALQASNYWHPGEPVEVDLAPATELAAFLCRAKLSQGKSLLRSVLAEILPRALALELQSGYWQERCDTPLAEFPDKALRALADALHRWTIRPAATEGYRTAEVTLGGVDTAELSSQTMQAHRQPGLYVIGEVVDVTGHLGGFNFQWAWASAQAAGNAV